ncbi:hypothetical protein XENOCAPTIV_018652, partial [Xenoophorus captivus]
VFNGSHGSRKDEIHPQTSILDSRAGQQREVSRCHVGRRGQNHVPHSLEARRKT